MPDPEVIRLMNALRQWCDEQYGRQAQIARVLGCRRQQVNDWVTFRTEPTLGTGLRIQNFLRTQASWPAEGKPKPSPRKKARPQPHENEEPCT